MKPTPCSDTFIFPGSVYHGGSFYYIDELIVFPDHGAYNAMQADMLSYPGHPVAIETAEESLFLAEWLDSRDIDEANTGARVLDSLRTWVWHMASDSSRRGTTIFATDEQPNMQFTNFTDKGGFFDLPNMYMSRTGEWVTAEARPRPTIVEFPTDRDLNSGTGKC